MSGFVEYIEGYVIEGFFQTLSDTFRPKKQTNGIVFGNRV